MIHLRLESRKKEGQIVSNMHTPDLLAGKIEYALVPQIQYDPSGAGQWPSVDTSSHAMEVLRGVRIRFCIV